VHLNATPDIQSWQDGGGSGGGGKSGPSDASAGRDFLLHTANRRTANDLGASAADASRLLEAVESPANLATALLNVVRNKGAPGVDGCSVKKVLGSARSLLPRLQRGLLDGTRVCTDEGTPQGGSLSPLLSNVVLDEFDKELARRGLRFIRYADDCNIFVRSERAVQRVMGSIQKFLQRRLRLLVNEEKSKVARPDEIHFLGFRLRKTKERTKVEVANQQRARTTQQGDQTPYPCRHPVPKRGFRAEALLGCPQRDQRRLGN